MKTVLTIAGSDSSGGAGIQADLKTLLANGVYGMSAVTALTAQNTTGVKGIIPVPEDFLRLQIESVFTDIRPDAVKIGMVASAGQMETIVSCLREYRAEHIVVDPVMSATTGRQLMGSGAGTVLLDRLCPLAELLTPNIPEAKLLSGQKISSPEDMQAAAVHIADRCGCAVLVKGGHSLQGASDLLYDKKHFRWFRGERIDNPNSHGTGCTLSSAIAANLAKGFDLETAVERAKAYLSGALSSMLDLGAGSGPLDHGFSVEGFYTEEA